MTTNTLYIGINVDKYPDLVDAYNAEIAAYNAIIEEKQLTKSGGFEILLPEPIRLTTDDTIKTMVDLGIKVAFCNENKELLPYRLKPSKSDLERGLSISCSIDPTPLGEYLMCDFNYQSRRQCHSTYSMGKHVWLFGISLPNFEMFNVSIIPIDDILFQPTVLDNFDMQIDKQQTHIGTPVFA